MFDLISHIAALHATLDDYDGKTVAEAQAKFAEISKSDSDISYFGDGNSETYAKWIEFEPELQKYNIMNVEYKNSVFMMTLCDDLDNPQNVYVYAKGAGYDESNYTLNEYWEEGNDTLLKYVDSLPEKYGNNINIIGYDSAGNNAVYAKIMSERIGDVHAVNGLEFPEWFMSKYADEIDSVRRSIYSHASDYYNDPHDYLGRSFPNSPGCYVSWTFFDSEDYSLEEYKLRKAQYFSDPLHSWNTTVLSPSFYVPGGYTYETRTTMYGMDLENVKNLIAKMLENANKIKDVSSSVHSALNNLNWAGPDIQEFSDKWQGMHAKQLQQAANALVESSEIVEKNRKEQVSASE